MKFATMYPKEPLKTLFDTETALGTGVNSHSKSVTSTGTEGVMVIEHDTPLSVGI